MKNGGISVEVLVVVLVEVLVDVAKMKNAWKYHNDIPLGMTTTWIVIMVWRWEDDSQKQVPNKGIAESHPMTSWNPNRILLDSNI